MLVDGKRFGDAAPRVFTPPLHPLEPRSPETERWTLGYDVVDFARDVLQMPLYPWQEWFFVHALELRADGSFRFKTLLLLVARQNGKSTISLVLGLFVLFILRWSTVLGVAQDLDTAEEILELATELVNAVDEDDDEESPLRPWLAEQVAKVVAINGKRSLQLKGRRRWKVKAASRGAGRGFSGDLILFDELREQKNWLAWGAITKSTMARPHALILALSNAGDILSAPLKHLRRIAHLALGDPDGIGELSALERFALGEDAAAPDGEGDDSLFIAEWSAAPGRAKTDRDGWCEANPSLGYMIEERTIAGACHTDPEWVFRTEVLCQWPDGAIEAPFPAGTWDACANSPLDGPTGPMLSPDDMLVGPLAACIDVTDDNSRAHITVAGFRADGVPQVEHRVSRVGTHWVEAYLSDPKVRRRLIGVTGQERGAPVSAVLAQLAASPDFKVPVVPCGGQDMLNSYVDFDKLVVGGGVRHNAQPALDAAAQVAAKRRLGGVDVLDRRNSPVDASPLIAAVGAVWLLQHPPAVAPTASMPPLPEVSVTPPVRHAGAAAGDLATLRF